MKNLLSSVVIAFIVVFMVFFVSPFIFALFIEQGNTHYFFSLINSILSIGAIWSFIKGKVREGVGLLMLAIISFYLLNHIIYY